MVTRIAEEIAVDDVNNYYSKKKSATGAAIVLTSWYSYDFSRSGIIGRWIF
jgi:hypothetical protein